MWLWHFSPQEVRHPPMTWIRTGLCRNGALWFLRWQYKKWHRPLHFSWNSCSWNLATVPRPSAYSPNQPTSHMCVPSWTWPLQPLVEMPRLVSTEWTSGESCPQSRSMSKGHECCFELRSFWAGLLCSDNWHTRPASLGNAVLFTKIIAPSDIATMFPSIHLLAITCAHLVWFQFAFPELLLRLLALSTYFSVRSLIMGFAHHSIRSSFSNGLESVLYIFWIWLICKVHLLQIPSFSFLLFLLFCYFE